MATPVDKEDIQHQIHETSLDGPSSDSQPIIAPQPLGEIAGDEANTLAESKGQDENVVETEKLREELIVASEDVEEGGKVKKKKKFEPDTFEEILSFVGESGPWNFLLFFLLFLGPIVSPLAVVSYQFVGATPDYWCEIQELKDANWTTEEILDLAIPRKANGKLEGCLRRDYNYSMAASLGYEAAMENLDLITNVVNGTVSCPKRDYNHTQYKSTLVTEFDLVCERRALYSTTQAAVQIGKLIASAFIGYATDAFGKRGVILVCPLLTVLFSLLSSTAPNIEWYIFLKVLTTTFDMGYYVTCYVLALEICSKKQRSCIGSLYGVPWAMGNMMLAGIAYMVREWKYLQMVFSIPPLIFIIHFWLMPESPRWLILQGRFDDATKLLKKAAAMNGREMPPDAKLLGIMERIRHKDLQDHKGNRIERIHEKNISKRLLMSVREFLRQLADLFRTPTMARQTLIMFFAWFSTSFVYFGVAQNGTNVGANEYWYVFFGGLLEIPPSILMWPSVAILGRRITFTGLFLISAVAILGSLIPDDSVHLSTVLALIGKGAAVNCFSMVYLVSSELNTTKSRTVAVGISSVVARFGSVITPYINDLIGESNPSAPSFMFGTVACAAALLVFLLPETKEHVLPESLAEVEGLSKKNRGETEENPTNDLKRKLSSS